MQTYLILPINVYPTRQDLALHCSWQYLMIVQSEYNTCRAFRVIMRFVFLSVSIRRTFSFLTSEFQSGQKMCCRSGNEFHCAPRGREGCALRRTGHQGNTNGTNGIGQRLGQHNLTALAELPPLLTGLVDRNRHQEGEQWANIKKRRYRNEGGVVQRGKTHHILGCTRAMHDGMGSSLDGHMMLQKMMAQEASFEILRGVD